MVVVGRRKGCWRRERREEFIENGSGGSECSEPGQQRKDGMKFHSARNQIANVPFVDLIRRQQVEGAFRCRKLEGGDL